ncbi:23118_t:CDS:2, partial [Cetraspora pellucida]
SEKLIPKRFLQDNDMDLGEVPTELPRLSQVEEMLIVQYTNILAWLNYLKENNPFYVNIKIDHNMLQTLPKNATEEVATYNEINSLMNSDNIISWPTINDISINEFKDTGYITRAFFALFSTGKADLCKTSTFSWNAMQQDEKSMKKMISYVDLNVTAMNPNTFTFNRLQKYIKCSPSYCLVINKNTKLEKYQFGYSKKLHDSTIIQLNKYNKQDFSAQKTLHLLLMLPLVKLSCIFFTLNLNKGGALHKLTHSNDIQNQNDNDNDEYEELDEDNIEFQEPW